MKTIGILGGMSWESTAIYYRLLNEAVRDRLGGLHSARIVLYSFDFAAVAELQRAGAWDAATDMLIGAARGVRAAGADCLLIATNTMHKLAAPIEEALDDVPLLHIADATGVRLRRDGVRRVALLGTAFTMEQPFYRERLARHGVEVLIPDEADRALVHRVIFEELCMGHVCDASRQEYLRIIDGLAGDGAQGAVLGCTEIGLLVGQADTAVPLYDTTVLHVEAAVQYALG